MIKISDLIFEKFEIPPALQKQLETTGYSALGHILRPQTDKFKTKIFSNKELNEKSYNQIKNLIETIRKMTEGGGGNTTLTFTDVLIPEYYSVTTAKQQLRKCKITIERSGDDIYVQSDEKKDRVFPNFVIGKDYAGWDLHRVDEFWKQIDNSYQAFKNEFDEKLMVVSQIENKLEVWKGLDKAQKPKHHPDGERAVLVYEKTMPDGMKYEHYFRAMPSRKVDKTQYPDYFSQAGGSTAETPIITQTVFLDEFDTKEFYSVSSFMESVEQFIGTSRHEGRHLMQRAGNVQRNLKGDFYGGPKKGLRHQFNTDIRGINPSGEAGPDAKFKEPTDKWGRVLHPHRDVEFKTNLYNYKEDIEKMLGRNIPKSQWKDGFRDLLSYTVGKLHYTPFNQKFRSYGSTWPYTVAHRHLKALYEHDRPKFNQVVKELYKLIFNV